MKLANKLFIFALMLTGSASAEQQDSVDFFRLRCGSLIGEGYVMVYVNNKTYNIPVVCK